MSVYPKWAGRRPRVFSGRMWTGDVGEPAVGLSVFGSRGGYLGHVHYSPATARELADALVVAADAAELSAPDTRLDDQTHDVG